MVNGAGISHGSPYGYDRFVPLFVVDARKPEAAGKVETRRVLFTHFHDELVRILG